MSDEPFYTTTEQDFNEFERLTRKFVELFGLTDWEIGFQHKDDDENMASCGYNTGRRAVFALSRGWPYPSTLDELRRTAFHEVCELLLAEIWLTACTIDLTSAQRKELMDSEIHRVIRRLENVVLPRL